MARNNMKHANQCESSSSTFCHTLAHLQKVIIYGGIKDIFLAALNFLSKNIIRPVQTLRQLTQLVFWKKHELNWIKINIDDSFSDTVVGIGRVFGAHDGIALLMLSGPIVAVSPLQAEAEAEAVLTALRIVFSLDWSNLLVEMDSTILWKCSASLTSSHGHI